MINNYFLISILLLSMCCLYTCNNNDLNLFGICVKKKYFSEKEQTILQECVNKNNINNNTFKQCKQARTIWHDFMKKHTLCLKFFSRRLYCPLQQYKKIYEKIGSKMVAIDYAFSDEWHVYYDELHFFNKYYQLAGVLPEDKDIVIVSEKNCYEIMSCCAFAQKKDVCNLWVKRFKHLYSLYLKRAFEVEENNHVQNWGDATRYPTDMWASIPWCIKKSMARIKILKEQIEELEEK